VVAPDALDWVMLRHESGLDVLPAPPSPEGAECVTSELVSHLLPALKARYRWVVVDTASTFSDVNLTVLEQSDRVIQVTAPDIATLKSTQACQALFARVLGTRPKRQLVLNGIHARARLGRAEMQKTLGAQIDVVVPHSDAALEAIDHGTPLALTAPIDPLIQALDGYIRQFADVHRAATVPTLRSGLWTRISKFR
jgi:pilus assembly protein CpaE